LDNFSCLAQGKTIYLTSLKCNEVLAMSDQTKIKWKLRDDLTAEVREKAERIGSIEFKSAGAIRSANA